MTLAEASESRPVPERSPSAEPIVVILGNPNVGKTTLFNRLTGQNARVGNYPGVTVERRVGTVELGHSANRAPERCSLVDVPGAYSLSARSAEEQIAINATLGLGEYEKPALAVVVVDAGQLARNLYLVVQLIEFEIPLVVAVNMMDEVRNAPPDPAKLASALGIPCIPTMAASGEGVEALKAAIARELQHPRTGRVEVPYPASQRRAVDAVAEVMPAAWRSSVERDRALARWALTSIEEDDELEGIPDALRARCRQVSSDSGTDFDYEIIAARYAFIDALVPTLYERRAQEPERSRWTERVDRLVLHPVTGFATFLLVMTTLFQALFSWADPAIGALEDLVGWLQHGAARVLPDGFFSDLVREGLLGGVGNVIVFLPQILLLFLLIGILEDSGYMARVAYLMDRVMRSLGLHGRAFVPMLSGFACAIPAILATRTMERQRDRLLTMMVVPLMTCSARLPVYTLIIAALFPPTHVFGFVPVQGLLMAGMYVFATLVALVAAAVLGRTAIKGRRIPLILELPPYRVPRFSATLRMMWERSRAFLTDAGSVILVCTVVLWTLLSFPASAPVGDESLEQAAQHQMASSYAGRLGHAMEPVIAPLGFDWKIGVGIVGAFAAREVFVSTMGIVYGVGDDDEETEPLRNRMRAETRTDGSPAYTPLTGLSLMVFFALACQCMSTLAVVRRETKTWKWPLFMFGYMTALAWCASFVVYQGGRLLGLG